MSETSPRDAEQTHGNVDFARYRRLAAACRAAGAASNATQQLILAEREQINRLLNTFRGYGRNLVGEAVELAEALVDPAVEAATISKAQDLGVASRFPVGLAGEIRARRGKLAALEAEHEPEAARAEHLLATLTATTEYLREYKLVTREDRALPRVHEHGMGAGRPGGAEAFAGATDTAQPQSWKG